MARSIRLTRQSMSQFLKDQEQIKAFESLFDIAESVSENPDTQGTGIESGSAMSLASAAHASVESMRSVIEIAASSAAAQHNNASSVDYIEFHGDAPSSNAPRSAKWSNVEGTIVLNHEGGVQQSVGLETFVRVENTSVSVVAKGVLISQDGALFMANGAMFLAGVSAQSIDVGAAGLVTAFGTVDGIDTSAFSAGDQLYASPTIAGALINTVPAAPAVVVPVGFVQTVDAANGSIFVQPSLSEANSYGEFIKTASVTPAAANTAYPVDLTSAKIARGMSIGAPASRIVAANAGLYRFSARVQLASSSATVQNVWVWWRKNGVNIPNSAAVMSFETSGAIGFASNQSLVSLVGNDYVELMWATDATTVSITAIPTTAFAPASPSVSIIASQEQ